MNGVIAECGEWVPVCTVCRVWCIFHFGGTEARAKYEYTVDYTSIVVYQFRYSTLVLILYQSTNILDYSMLCYILYHSILYYTTAQVYA